MLDGAEGLSGAGPAGESASAFDSGVTFELDLESDATLDRTAGASDNAAPAEPPPAGGATGAGPSAQGSASPDHQALLGRIEAAERRALEAQAVVAPWLQAIGQQQAGNQPQRITREQLNHPDVTVGQVIAYFEQQQNETRTTAAQQAQLEARRGASELYARGLLSAEAMGGADDSFDAMRERYVRPLYDSQPYLRDVIHAMFPEQPSLGEFAVAWVRRIAEAAQNDPVQTYRRLSDFARGGAPAAARQVVRSLADAAARGADRISPGGGGRTTSAEARSGDVRRIDGREMWRMSDADFDRLDQQLTEGL